MPLVDALVARGYAVAGCGTVNFWPLEENVPHQMNLMAMVDDLVGTPTRRICFGESIGGLMTATIVQRHGESFDGALPLCPPIAGAVATLLAQWWLIPQLRLSPRLLVFWGSILAAAGAAITGLHEGVYGITLGFALASLGFGFFRPGFTSGASLSVELNEQNEVAGMVTSVNGVAFIAAPALGVLLYGLWMPLPFVLTSALMLALAIWVMFRFNPSGPAA